MTIYIAGAAGGWGYFNNKANTVSNGGAGGTIRWVENIVLVVIFINIRVIKLILVDIIIVTLIVILLFQSYCSFIYTRLYDFLES